MFSVKELRSLAASLSIEQFRRQLGPFALVQRPPTDRTQKTDQMGIPTNAMETAIAPAEDISRGILSLLFEFEDLIVASLPPLKGLDELSVGRQPDCDLVLDDPSVSKRHATLRWDAHQQRCTVQDLGSTNGTFLNASVMVHGETLLRDGDIVSFGEVQFWFLLAGTLHGKLSQLGGSARLGARSG